MKKEFVMRGQTKSGQQEVLNFSGYKPGYAYRMTEFQLYGSTGLGAGNFSGFGIITAAKTTTAPTDPNFNDEGLIAVSMFQLPTSPSYPVSSQTIVNDTFLITQNLILMVQEENGTPVNWQCRFESVKMSGPEEATANYKQFTISDG